jgi:hypothetical protein
MEEDSPTGESPTSPKSPRRARGRPRREAIERENLATMLKSNLSNDVSKRFLQKMNLLKVRPFAYRLTIAKAETEAEIVQL